MGCDNWNAKLKFWSTIDEECEINGVGLEDSLLLCCVCQLFTTEPTTEITGKYFAKALKIKIIPFGRKYWVLFLSFFF